jgi:K+-sensing histidine kinase KdpD
LNSDLLMVPKLAIARARPPVGNGNKGSFQLENELPSDRVFLTEVWPLLMSLMGVSLITAVLLLVAQDVAANLVPIAYLIPVIIAATRWGIWPATLAAIAGMAEADFFFFPPIYSFQVDDPQEVIDLIMFLVVAFVSSNLASRLRRETETLRQREKEIKQLYEFSRLLAVCFTLSDLISAIQKYLSRTLGQQAAFFAATTDGRFESPESGSVPEMVRESVAEMTATIEIPARIIVDDPTRNVWLLGAVSSETAVHGLVAVNIGGGSREAVAIKTRRVESILEEVSLTLQRLDIEKANGGRPAAPAGAAAARRVSRPALARIVHAAGRHPGFRERAGFDARDSKRQSDPLAGRGNIRRGDASGWLHSKPPERDTRYRGRPQPTPRMGRSE